MSSFFQIFLILSLGLFLSACPLTTRDDVQDENQLKEQMSSMQRSKADNDQRITDVQSDLRVVAGRVDALDHNIQVSDSNSRKDIEDIRKQLQAENEKMKQIEQHIDATETRLMAAIQGNSQTPSSNNAAASAGGVGLDAGKKKETNNFTDAEALFGNHDYKKAIVKFQAYRDKNPQGSKLSEATYKIGICFAELGLKKDAKEFFRETIESFPGTSQAKKAKIRLARLK